MSHALSADTTVARPTAPAVPAIPVAAVVPWLALAGLLALAALFFLSVDQGAVSVGGSGTLLHELVHDGRHLLGFPCH